MFITVIISLYCVINGLPDIGNTEMYELLLEELSKPKGIPDLGFADELMESMFKKS